MQWASTLEVGGPGVEVLRRRVHLPDTVGMLTLTFRTLFRRSEAIVEEPPEERGG